MIWILKPPLTGFLLVFHSTFDHYKPSLNGENALSVNSSHVRGPEQVDTKSSLHVIFLFCLPSCSSHHNLSEVSLLLVLVPPPLCLFLVQFLLMTVGDYYVKPVPEHKSSSFITQLPCSLTASCSPSPVPSSPPSSIHLHFSSSLLMSLSKWITLPTSPL